MFNFCSPPFITNAHEDLADLSEQLAASRIMGPPQPINLVSNGSNHHYHQTVTSSSTNVYHSNGTSNGYSNGSNGSNGIYTPESVSPPSDRPSYHKGNSTTIYHHEDGNSNTPFTNYFFVIVVESFLLALAKL